MVVASEPKSDAPAMTGALRLDFLDPDTQLAECERIWTELARANPPAYFTSWGWMKTWIEGLPKGSGLKLAVFRRGSDPGPLMACFLGYRTVTRRKVFRSVAYLLNETGDPRYDQVYSEYNGFLSRAPFATRDEMPTLQEIVSLLPGKWEEFCFSGVDVTGFPGARLDEEVPGFRMNIVNLVPAPFVDLEAIGQAAAAPATAETPTPPAAPETKGKNGKSKDASPRKNDPLALYLSALSSNTRSQIKRCYKLYRERGEIVTRIATEPEEALRFYHEMKELHQAAWKAKGESGAFSNPWFDEFHQRLIRNRFAHGEIQLVRVTAGENLIGVIYNFVLSGRVYYYQAGFRFESDNRMKAGYLCHAEAIRANLELGARRYEFLGGYEDFKLRLSTDKAILVWARLQKPLVKFTVENWARETAIWAVEKWKSRSGKKTGRQTAGEAIAADE